jgi:hypothetical protein
LRIAIENVIMQEDRGAMWSDAAQLSFTKLLHLLRILAAERLYFRARCTMLQTF